MPKRTRPLSPDYGAPKSDGPVVEEPTNNARQGATGHNVRYVLAISLVVLIALFAIIYLIYQGAA